MRQLFTTIILLALVAIQGHAAALQTQDANTDSLKSMVSGISNAPERRSATMRDIIRHDFSGSAVVKDHICYVRRGHFLCKEITSDLFFLDGNGYPRLVCHPHFMDKSIQNIMLTGLYKRLIAMRIQYTMEVNKTDTLNTTVQQFVNYCLDKGCKLYLGIKGIGEESLEGTLIAVNEPSGYCHVLSIAFPTSIISGTSATVETTMDPFVPLKELKESLTEQSLQGVYQTIQ